jgi:CRISPR-associated protein Cmr3
MALRGPLLVQLSDDGISDWMLPAPADALLLDAQTREDSAEATKSVTDVSKVLTTVLRRQLVPQDDQPMTNMQDGLALVGPTVRTPEKVSGDAPRFWHKAALWHWLLKPGNDKPALSSLGIGRLETNTRMHVSIQPEQQTAREGALFQTSGLEFTWRDREQEEVGVFDTRRLALAAWFDGDCPHFWGGFAPLGGERRLMRWQSDLSGNLFSDEEKKQMFARIEAERHCRVVLLTPACFADGYRPPLQWVRGGVTAILAAAAVPRMQVVSGWDLAANNGRGTPKPTRYLTSAGSVYFVEFPDGVDIHAWLEATWMHNISDDAQACRDGFGLAVVGAWSPDGKGNSNGTAAS